jgi:hypothetical protein
LSAARVTIILLKYTEIMKYNGINIERPDNNAFTPKATVPKTIMLVLTKFRNINRTADLALKKASQYNKLVILCIYKLNLSQYFAETDIGFYPGWKKECEKELLRHYILRCREKAEPISELAKKEGIQTATYIRVGHFVLTRLNIIKKENPSLVITNRPLRPALFRRIFQCPADYLKLNAGCKVIEV